MQVKAARAERRDAAGAAPAAVVADGLTGGRILAAHAPIAPQGWLVFVERPAAAAYAPLYAPIIRSVVIFVLGLGLSILASILLARRMVAPIRTLQEGAARIGAGDLAHRIEIRTGDELETLGDELNRTATRLEESYAGLERKVAERTHDLTEALRRLTALSEVGRAVSSTLDVQAVLNSIVVHAGPLAGADGCAIYEYDEASQEFHLRATHNYDPALVAAIGAVPLRRGEGVMGRAAALREPIQVPDITQPGAYETRQRDVLVRAGFRALLSVPLLFEDRVIGSLSVNRKAPGEYGPDVIEVLKTFAAQSVLSLENARLFREIADKSRELEIASQHKSEFLANMSHELRTPLNAVIGFSEVLLDRMFGDLNDKQTEYLHDIMGSGRHLLSLINDILDLSKIEAGRMELEPSEFHLPTALDDACTLVRERASRRTITLRIAVDERVGEIRADERKIKQIMLNLLSNAIKFTPEGGRIEVRAVPSNGSVEVSVTDTGIGIAPEDQDAVFEEFRQVGTSAARREGTGLGLALCRKFIELHGGTIWVKSQVGVGSTFTFTLPVGA
jgi:signal transduction histidine kinase